MKYKRQYRELSDETKQKLSVSHRNKPKSEHTKRLISQSMQQYWKTVPHRPQDTNNGVQPKTK